MSTSLKKRLEKVNNLLAQFEQLVHDFPDNSAYRKSRDQLLQQRDTLCASIGRRR